MKEERQAHTRASQQQMDKHAVEVQDGQQGRAGASPTASITQLEDKVQVHSFTFSLPSAFNLSPNSACLTVVFHLLNILAGPHLKIAAVIHWPSVGLLLSSMRLIVSLHTSGHHFSICVIILQAADRGLTPPPPPGLARPSGPVSPSSNTTGGRKGNASLSSGMPTATSPDVGSPHSQPGQQFQGNRGSAPALAPAAREGFGFGLRSDMLRRLGNGDGNPFGGHASWSDRGQGDRQADTNRPGLSNKVQTPPSSEGSSGSGGSNRGRGRGRHATAGGHFGGRQQQPPGGHH